MNVLIVIPARGGSKGIPRKNVRLLAGRPLIEYCIKTALQSRFSPEVVVSTDDLEIERISSQAGAMVIIRPSHLGDDNVPLDPVVFHAVNVLEERFRKTFDVVVTMQPTSPLLRTSTLDNAISQLRRDGVSSVISVVNHPHLAWREEHGVIMPAYSARLNRQELPAHYMETGAFLVTRRVFVTDSGRLGPDIAVFPTSAVESIDIDAPHDWWLAEKELEKKNILIRVEGYSEIGLGHVYRGILLAENLIDHNVKFVVSAKSVLGLEKIRESHFPYFVIEEDLDVVDVIREFAADILVNDVLDTSVAYVEACKMAGVRVVNFEDLGAGGAKADAVVNDLYEKQSELPNHYWGSDYYCIRDEFRLASPSAFNEDLRKILIVFGGTDPSNLTEKTLRAVTRIAGSGDIQFQFVLGLGYQRAEVFKDLVARSSIHAEVVQDVKRMSDLMADADLAISSQGRTMLELASMQVPTILLAQNRREQHHEFGYLSNGFINLGLGADVSEGTISHTVEWLIKSPQIRKQMKSQMAKVDLKGGMERVKRIILGRGLTS